MRVGLLTSWLSHHGGGIPEAVRPLSLNLAAQGCDVHVFGLAESTWTGGLQEGWRGTTVEPLKPLPPHGFGYAPALARKLGAAQPHLVHVHGLWMQPSLVSLRWSQRHRRPRIVSPHGMLDPWAVRRSAWKKSIVGALFESAHLRGAACLHALNEAEAQAIRAYGLRNPICVIPNGIDLPEVETLPRPAWADAVEGRKTLLFLGRLHPKKGLVNLIRAWNSVQRDPVARDWVLIIAGWNQGGHEQELRLLADGLALAETVRFVGPQFDGDKVASYAFADAFVLPSLSEGLPVAVLEAWSWGLPVLMTSQCNLPEGFAAGAALRIEPNPAGIAEGLRSLFAKSDPERRAIGVRGRVLVAERFTWPRIAEEMRDVYAWVLGGGSAPAGVTSA